MNTFIVFLVGMAIGYWIYYWRMFYKMYKIKKHIDEAEKIIAEIIMETRAMVDPEQWNEDKL